MTNSYAGGCACGAVRYETDDTPIFENHCQCRDCQRRSGTGHGSYVTFGDRGRVEAIGLTESWRVKGDSGNEKIHSFCPHCGAQVSLTFAAMPNLFSVPVGSLDEPSRFNPQIVTYTSKAQPWDFIDRSLVSFDRMPVADQTA